MSKHTMTARLPKERTDNGKHHDKKEQVSFFQVVALRNNEFHQPITIRCWMSRSASASTVYASIWIQDRKRDCWYAGSGSAGGWGYHKESAAIQDALTSAGVKLFGSPYSHPSHTAGCDLTQETHIDGVGESAIQEALYALARALGYRKFTVVRG